MPIFRFFVAAILLIMSSESSIACGDNEYEQCWSIDLGITKAKDCKCLPKWGGSVGKAAEDLKPTVSQIAKELQKSPEAIKECLGNIQKCAMEILSAPLAAPVQIYIDGLYKQSAGKTQSFSPEFVSLVQPYYSTDISGITYANDINTGHGMNVAYCDRIFFTGHGSVWVDKNELRLTLHELEHTVQCQKRGKTTFLAEYVLKASADIIKTGRLNVHDIHDFEQAADTKANQLTDILWQKIVTRAVPIPPSGGQLLGTGTNVSSGGVPPGTVVQGCGCWGPTANIVPTPICASGAASAQPCGGTCYGGGVQYGYVCN
jgi:hypothetical protein